MLLSLYYIKFSVIQPTKENVLNPLDGTFVTVSSGNLNNSSTFSVVIKITFSPVEDTSK